MPRCRRFNQRGGAESDQTCKHCNLIIGTDIPVFIQSMLSHIVNKSSQNIVKSIDTRWMFYSQYRLKNGQVAMLGRGSSLDYDVLNWKDIKFGSKDYAFFDKSGKVATFEEPYTAFEHVFCAQHHTTPEFRVWEDELSRFMSEEVYDGQIFSMKSLVKNVLGLKGVDDDDDDEYDHSSSPYKKDTLARFDFSGSSNFPHSVNPILVEQFKSVPIEKFDLLKRMLMPHMMDPKLYCEKPKAGSPKQYSKKSPSSSAPLVTKKLAFKTEESLDLVIYPRIREILKAKKIVLDKLGLQVTGRQEDIDRAVDQISEVPSLEPAGRSMARMQAQPQAPQPPMPAYCIKPPPGKVLNPNTGRFIDAKGSLAKKLGLSINSPPKPKQRSPSPSKAPPTKAKPTRLIRSPPRRTTKPASPRKSYKGQVVLFTGFRRPDLQAKIEQGGGKVKNNFAKDVTLVVALDPNGHTAKLDAARQYGIRVVGLDWFSNNV